MPHLTSPHPRPDRRVGLGPIAITKERRGWPCRCIRQSSYTPKRTSAEARRCAIIGPAFGSVSALAAGLGTGGPPPCPRPIRSPGPLARNVARSCSLLNGSCRCQLESTLSPCKGCVCACVHARWKRRKKQRETGEITASLSQCRRMPGGGQSELPS